MGCDYCDKEAEYRIIAESEAQGFDTVLACEHHMEEVAESGPEAEIQLA